MPAETEAMKLQMEMEGGDALTRSVGEILGKTEDVLTSFAGNVSQYISLAISATPNPATILSSSSKPIL